jgi:hypothetical protein
MTSKELTYIASQWMKFFNDKELDKLLSLYDDEAEHYSPKLKVRHPETNGLIKGKAALHAWWKDAFDRLPTLHYTPVRFTPYHDRVFMEYTRHVVNEEDLHIGEMLEIKNGKITTSAVFHR